MARDTGCIVLNVSQVDSPHQECPAKHATAALRVLAQNALLEAQTVRCASLGVGPPCRPADRRSLGRTTLRAHADPNAPIQTLEQHSSEDRRLLRDRIQRHPAERLSDFAVADPIQPAHRPALAVENPLPELARITESRDRRGIVAAGVVGLLPHWHAQQRLAGAQDNAVDRPLPEGARAHDRS